MIARDRQAEERVGIRLAELIENNRDDARAIQATLMGGRDALAASLLTRLIERIYEDVIDIPERYRRGKPKPDEVVFELREAEYALRDRRVGDAIYRLEKFIHPSPAVTIKSEREMRRFTQPPAAAGGEAPTGARPVGRTSTNSASPAGGVAGG